VSSTARGQGVGEALLRGTLTDLQARGVRTVGLYSVPKAVTLYRRLGFVEEGAPVEAWGIDLAEHDPAPPPRGVRLARPEDTAALAPLDLPRFGFDRTALLQRLFEDYPRTSFVLEREGQPRGFIVAKPSATGTEIGPGVLADPEDEEGAGALLDAALAALTAEGVTGADLALRGENRMGRALLKTRGFTERFTTFPMFHGAPGHRGAPASILAIGGLEKG